MSTPLTQRYKGYTITVQAIRRPNTDRDQPDSDLHEYDCVVNISRQASGASGRSAMLGVPTTQPFDSPIAATHAALEYAYQVIDGKVEGQSLEGL